MKYIKEFENISNDDIKVGDYVLVDIHGYRGMGAEDFMNFINSNIGRIIEIEAPDKRFDNISIEYENVPENIRNPWFNKDNYNKIFKKVRYNRIIANSKNIEDIERILIINKFNI
jgi:hypothetical protein